MMTTVEQFDSEVADNTVYVDESDKPRPLDTLLKLDTYQGMTDTEIRLVIAYKEQLAMESARATNMAAQIEESYAKLAESNATAYGNLERTVREAMALQTSYSRVVSIPSDTQVIEGDV